MKIRTATKEDLPRIVQLREEFGHSMLYQYFPELMEKYLDRILVAEEPIGSKIPTLPFGAPIEDTIEYEVVGYYHYIASGDPGFGEMLRCYKQMPTWIIKEILLHHRSDQDWKSCVLMQGACHRDVFEEVIKHLQSQYNFLWCWNSITNSDKPSGKIQGYKTLGFTYSPEEKHTFWNVHKGDYSTYCLGRWRKV